jgi:transcription initiation factor IIF auxiliary subunit
MTIDYGRFNSKVVDMNNQMTDLKRQMALNEINFEKKIAVKLKESRNAFEAKRKEDQVLFLQQLDADRTFFNEKIAQMILRSENENKRHLESRKLADAHINALCANIHSLIL